mmetsp:Transcript_8893/g.12233  ORF Transcript_8893/g.12233 Transcript_8893/m.12233 type:complete len:177 (-) Transcript_8893:59-589(-)
MADQSNQSHNSSNEPEFKVPPPKVVVSSAQSPNNNNHSPSKAVHFTASTNDSDQILSTSPTKSSVRHKVPLGPGHSLLDWMKLSNSGKDLSGTGGRLFKVPLSEVKKHKTEEDCWMVVRGKVYNVTPYLKFHPGGVDELMRGAGKDATKLFEWKHGWVNIESMLEKCLIGFVVPDE